MFRKSLLYLLTILEAIEKISVYCKEMSNAQELFDARDQLHFNASMNLLIAIGEESNKLDRELKARFIFDWRSVISLRNKLSHDYRGTDPYIIWDIITNSLPPLKRVCLEMFDFIKTESDLSQDYLMRVAQSGYYKHLSYLLERSS
ncbi:MAG: HepT-like ribonuclease domain-containing protein [Candidatus Margulisiibacteriota bacterium]